MVEVRRATGADVALLVRHRRAMWYDMGVVDNDRLDAADKAYEPWIRARLNDDSTVAFILDDDAGATLASGCVWLQPVQPSPLRAGTAQPYLHSVYVEPHARRQGHAQRILDEGMAWARGRGFDSFALHASQAGRPLYEKNGFEAAPNMWRAL